MTSQCKNFNLIYFIRHFRCGGKKNLQNFNRSEFKWDQINLQIYFYYLHNNLIFLQIYILFHNWVFYKDHANLWAFGCSQWNVEVKPKFAQCLALWQEILWMFYLNWIVKLDLQICWENNSSSENDKNKNTFCFNTIYKILLFCQSEEKLNNN